METINILLVDANRVTRTGIETILQHSPLPVGKIRSSERLESSVAGYDVLLLDDAHLDGGTMGEVVAGLLEEQSELKILLMSETLSVSYIRSAMANGALGFIYKHDDLESAVISGVSIVLRSLPYHSPKVSALLSNHNQLVLMNKLSEQDMQVLRLTAAGHTVPEIALTLCISERSVYRSRKILRDVLDAATPELIVDAARGYGLLD